MADIGWGHYADTKQVTDGEGRRTVESWTYEEYERYANSGSPSGFGLDELLDTPFHPTSRRYFEVAKLAALGRVVELGQASEVLDLLGFERDEVPLHPANPRIGRLASCEIRTGPLAWATSSTRTIALADTPSCHLKLDYDGQLGRTLRQVTLRNGIHSEIVRRQFIGSDPIDNLHVYLEVGSRFILEGQASFGAIIRNFEEYPPLPNVERIPLFALYNLEGLIPGLNRHFETPDSTMNFVSRFANIVVQCYVDLSTMLGLHVELNAQNLILLVGVDGDLKGLGLRDFQDMELDLSSQQPAGLEWVSIFPYKILGRDLDSEYWRLRHSIAFDFKLTRYVLSPLVELAERRHESLAGRVWREAVAPVAPPHLSRLATDYFPSGRLGFRYHAGPLVTERPVVQDVPLLLRPGQIR